VELKDINIEETRKKAKALLDQEKDLSPAIKATMNVLILVGHLFANRVGFNSRNSSKPDETLVINIDKKTLPAGHYTEDRFETRQVFDIHICRKVTENQAQVLVNDEGERFVAPFPKAVSKAVQYGPQVKAHAVYMSQYQLIPYARIQEYFTEQLEIPISKGSIFNFNKVACGLLDPFSEITKEPLINACRELTVS
jgi:transposase